MIHPEIKKVLRQAHAAVGELPFTLTPGKRRTIGRFVRSESGNRFVDMPVVVLRGINRGPARGIVVKFPDNGIRHLPARFCANDATAHDWARALWQWPANAQAIGGAS